MKVITKKGKELKFEDFDQEREFDHNGKRYLLERGWYRITKKNIYKIFFDADDIWIGRLFSRDKKHYGWFTCEAMLRVEYIQMGRARIYF